MIWAVLGIVAAGGVGYIWGYLRCKSVPARWAASKPRRRT